MSSTKIMEIQFNRVSPKYQARLTTTTPTKLQHFYARCQNPFRVPGDTNHEADIMSNIKSI